MTKEDKELLLKDLSGRLPYKVMGSIKGYEETYYDSNSGRYFTNFIDNPVEIVGISLYTYVIYLKYLNIPYVSGHDNFGGLKPYLRPMSSMTRQECTQLNVLLPRYFIVTPECLACLDHVNGGIINFEVLDTIIDFYNSHHLDWRGLIPKGLALEAPKDMYNIK